MVMAVVAEVGVTVGVATVGVAPVEVERVAVETVVVARGAAVRVVVCMVAVARVVAATGVPKVVMAEGERQSSSQHSCSPAPRSARSQEWRARPRMCQE